MEFSGILLAIYRLAAALHSLLAYCSLWPLAYFYLRQPGYIKTFELYFFLSSLTSLAL